MSLDLLVSGSEGKGHGFTIFRVLARSAEVAEPRGLHLILLHSPETKWQNCYGSSNFPAPATRCDSAPKPRKLSEATMWPLPPRCC